MIDYLKTQGALNTTLVARLAEPSITKIEARIDGKPVDAELEDSISTTFNKFMDAQVLGIPLGGIIVGGSISVLATELVDGFIVPKAGATEADIQTNKYIRGGVKLGLAAVAGLYGKKIFGKTGATTIALLVGFDGFRDIIPLDTWIKTNIADKITGQAPAGGLAQGRPVYQNRPSSPSPSYLEI